ncbi:MAG: biotin--[acetyl-CoA-carboxylase] ligase [Oscillospiraceae bacterium]
MSVKSQVVTFLEENRGEFISGGKISKALSVSRNAVWKVIKALEIEGYPISAVKNRGYCLSEKSDILSEESIKPFLKTEILGGDISVFKAVDSTNNSAKIAAQNGAKEGAVVLSESQSAGKGRLGRNFFSPVGTGIFMSIVLRPKFSAENATLITSCAAVAVARAIENLTGLDVKIKWVNDIFIGGKKVCGILTEAGVNFEGGTLDYAVLGIGINVLTAEFPEELRDVATSILLENGAPISRSRLAAEILNVFEPLYINLLDKKFMEEYVSRSNLIGKELTVFCGESSYKAVAIGIDGDARLIVRNNGGEEIALSSGEVSVRPL